MKKFLTVLMLAAMILSVGCGNKVEEVKQEAASDVKDAATKVEQKAAEVTGTAPTTSTARIIAEAMIILRLRACFWVIGFLLRLITSCSCLRITFARRSLRFFSLYSSM